MAKVIEYYNEADVKREVKSILKKTGWFYWMPSANAFGKSGVADILALRTGIFLAVETKFGKNKPTAMQVGFLNSINAEGGIGLIVNDKSVEAFREWMDIFLKAGADMHREKRMEAADGARMLDLLKIMTEELAVA